MSNPVVSFRISDYHLARGLRAIRLLEPAWQLTTASDLVRTIFNDFIAKSEHQHNSPLDVTPELIAEVVQSRTPVTRKTSVIQTIMPTIQTSAPIGTRTPEQTEQDIKDEQLFNELNKQAALEKASAQSTPDQSIDKQLDEQIALALNQQPSKTITPVTEPAPKEPIHKAPEEYETESDISTVTDFSPPTDWKAN